MSSIPPPPMRARWPVAPCLSLVPPLRVVVIITMLQRSCACRRHYTLWGYILEPSARAGGAKDRDRQGLIYWRKITGLCQLRHGRKYGLNTSRGGSARGVDVNGCFG